MGYYQQRSPGDGDDRPGCLDALALTRAIFGVLVWPFGIMVLAILDIATTFFLYGKSPWLALLPIGLSAAGIGAFVRWERTRTRPPTGP